MTLSLDRVPCSIITGFLGAGKTTLVRHILSNPKGKRLAVIVNEFGDVGIDGDVLKGCGIQSCPEENIVELANGCLCCTVADDFVPALDAILAREPKVDHILIETSGLALPKPLVQAFNWPGIQSRVTVDGVIAVVDGAALAEGRVAADMDALAAQRLADETLDHDDPVEEVFLDQLACADLVVMTKTDLFHSEVGRNHAHAAVKQAMPPAVRVIECSGGAIDPSLLLGLGLDAQESIGQRRTLHDDEGDHEHDDFDSFIVDLPEIESPDIIVERIRSIARDHGVLRVKGFLPVTGKSMRLQVQAVGARVTHQFDRSWGEGHRAGRLVVIGLNGMDRESVCLALRG